MFCSKCGTELTEREEYCPQCGIKVKQGNENIINNADKHSNNCNSREIIRIISVAIWLVLLWYGFGLKGIIIGGILIGVIMIIK